MTRTTLTLTLAVCLAVACFGQQPAKTKSTKLPFGWSKIGLSDAQKKQATAIITEANGKVAELQRQIDAIRAKEKSDLNALLSQDQRAELRKLLDTKAGLEAPAKESTKDKK